jgi:hypothetical protein
MIGTEFAGYRIEDQVGRGGASVVYLAVNLGLGNRVALKVLAPEFFDDDAVRVRFVRESQIAASINHPNIIPIHNAGSDAGYLYIAMRYVEGADLKALLVQEGALRPKRAMAIIRQVARALDTAHQRGLVHRDVKPANILLEEVGTDHEHAYLADFGLTKRRESHSGLTGSGHFIGTIDYMAPEQIEGGDVDGRADVYALACLGYQCLTGIVPFPKDVEMAVLWAHINEAPPAPSTTRPDLPAALDAVIARGMAKSRRDRYATCGELVAAMDAALGLHAADAPATGAVGYAGALEPEPVVGSVAVSEPVFQPVVPVDPGPEMPGPVSPDPDRHDEAAPPDRAVPPGGVNGSKRPPWRTVAIAAAILVFAGFGGYYLTTRGGDAGAAAGMKTSPDMAGMSSLQKFAFAALGKHLCSGTKVEITCHHPPSVLFKNTKVERVVRATYVRFTAIPTISVLVGEFQSVQGRYHLAPNKGECLVDRRHDFWYHEDDWWHTYPKLGEHQDGTDTSQRAVFNPNGTVLCTRDRRTGKYVVVWTQQGLPEEHGVLVLGRVAATTPLAAYRYWFAVHHNVMLM